DSESWRPGTRPGRRRVRASRPAPRARACAPSLEILAADQEHERASRLLGGLDTAANLGREVARAIGDRVGQPPGGKRRLRHAALRLVVVDGIAAVAAIGHDEEARDPVEIHEPGEDAAAVEEPRVLDQHRAAAAGEPDAARDRDRFLLARGVDGADCPGFAYRRHQPADPGVRHRGREGHPGSFETADDPLRAGSEGRRAQPCLRSSSRPIWRRCTSSGPSAKRKVRECAHIDASGNSWLTPPPPWSCMARSTTRNVILGTATLISAIACLAALLPTVSIMYAACSTSSRAWSISIRDCAMRSSVMSFS